MRQDHLLKVTIALSLCLAAGLVSANPIDQRGYDTCVNDVARDYSRHAGLMHARYYFLARDDTARTYFVNSTAWQEGDRVNLRTRCRTDLYGRDLLARETELGRWVQRRGVVSVEEVSYDR